VALCEAVSLHVPRVGGLFILRTDASGLAISGCLYQRDDDVIENVVVTGDGEKPISFYSQKLTRSQMSWSVIEREAYAVIASLKRFFPIVFGSTIIVYSDHNPLTFIVEGCSQSAKLTRWSLALQQYNVIFRYAKAKHNLVADYFSRCVSEAREGQH
jgi:RNase H-like domain found in reverse transcriptase